MSPVLALHSIGTQKQELLINPINRGYTSTAVHRTRSKNEKTGLVIIGTVSDTARN